jgi:hypothetical protein
MKDEEHPGKEAGQPDRVACGQGQKTTVHNYLVFCVEELPVMAELKENVESICLGHQEDIPA